MSATRNRELEAAIAADPDDQTGILVYGDWLQGHGDPRGTLIALQQAGDRKAVKALLAEHDHALTGLAGRHGTQVKLDWGLGFFYGATLTFNNHDKMMEALADVISHPSACFLQELVVQMPRVRDVLIDFDAVAELLLQHGPRTLRRLLVGRPGEWRIPEAIFEAFARLRQDDAAAWREALERVRSHRKLKIGVDCSRLPPLALRDRGLSLSDEELDAQTIVMGMRMELDKRRDLRLIETMTQIFTLDSLDRFALELMNQWRSSGERSADRWIYDAVGAVGGEHCVADIGSRLVEMSHQRATAGLAHLAKIGTVAAISEIAALAIVPSRFAPRREAARSQLEALAKGRKMTVADLLLQSCPRSVAADHRKRVVFAQQRWLFDRMVGGERMSADDFALHIAHHSLRGPIAAGLLWAVLDSKNKLLRLFRLDANAGNGPVDEAGAPVDLDGQIGLPHPVEIGEELERWRPVFADVTQPFSQLDRRTYDLQDNERGLDTLTRFAGRRVGFHQIRDGLEMADWFPYIDHGTEAFGRTFRRGRPMTFVATVDNGEIPEVWAQKVSHRWMSNEHIALDKVHPVVISEVLLDINRTLGNPSARQPARPAAAAAKPVAAEPAGGATLPQTGGFPFAELAKSGRSKCVVCGEKIEKQSVRVGVERMIETPSFTRKGTAWLHPACIGQCPELAGLDDVDARLRANSDGVWPP